MSKKPSRREILTRLGGAGVGAILGRRAIASVPPSHPTDARHPIALAGHPVELSLTAVSAQTLAIRLLPIAPNGKVTEPEPSPVLVLKEWPEPLARMRSLGAPSTIKWGKLRVKVTPEPLTLRVESQDKTLVQQVQIDSEKGGVSFMCGQGPVFGLGEGGQQFNRRGGTYPMNHGQRVPNLVVIGARLPIPWLISPEGWALFFSQPFGQFDLTGHEGHFTPQPTEQPLSLELFVVAAHEPADLLAEYARLTGSPHMPPIWALGYQQSHRTLASREEVMSEAEKFRRDKLPCDVLIYLGTGFCPSGWNMGHGSFEFNPKVFPDPARMIQELHSEHFRIVLHDDKPPKQLHGRVTDTGAAAQDPEDAADYWKQHVKVFDLGIDGWWADEGDWLSERSCLVRNRMYWEGAQLERPNIRPYTLNRNGYAGIQRYGWLWSGDIDSTWEALRAQVAVGLNTALSGMPYWGTDTGGFVTTKELTGELYVRWFQFSAFCPLFRSHGRTWQLRLPWGWNTGEYGPTELERYRPPAGLPDPKELHNPEVEPICRKYLDLRYGLMPYLYSAVREAHDTGLPIMRPLCLYYADDPHAVERDDEYLWGRDLLVAPVTEKGATSRRLYLPSGLWYDFWTEEKIEGGREIVRPVDLATMPLYVRAGSCLAMGPAEQYATEETYGSLTFHVYPGADGAFDLYEDDGITFDYQRGQSMRMQASWRERERQFGLRLAEGSKMLGPQQRTIDVRLAASPAKRQLVFDGKPITLRF